MNNFVIVVVAGEGEEGRGGEDVIAVVTNIICLQNSRFYPTSNISFNPLNIFPF